MDLFLYLGDTLSLRRVGVTPGGRADSGVQWPVRRCTQKSVPGWDICGRGGQCLRPECIKHGLPVSFLIERLRSNGPLKDCSMLEARK